MSLVLENTWTTALDSTVILEWLDADNIALETVRKDVLAQPGKSIVDLPLPMEKLRSPLLARLRYSVNPGAKNYMSFRPKTGIQNLIDIADYAFTTRTVSPGVVAPGTTFEARIFTTHPVTGKPVRDVEISFGNAKTKSDVNGIAVVQITSVEDAAPGFGGRSASLGDFHIVIGGYGPQVESGDIRITLDKPIYQPGQTVHMRILARKGSQQVRADADHSLEVTDERGEEVFRSDLKTSRFGIAATDWAIPATAEPGRYSVRVEDKNSNVETQTVLTVRRYELPSFRVSVKPDRPYYLPGQTPQLEIKGEYLFGKPVSQGAVRVVADQSDEPDEPQKPQDPLLKGSLDASGTFKANLALKQEMPDYVRFVDRHYIAFVTDASTNRTEQRKFDLRLSRNSLHVYVVKSRPFPGGQRIYATAYTPDGAPAQASLTISAGGNVLGTGRTNRYGLARIDIGDSDATELKFEAATATGERTSEAIPDNHAESSLSIQPARILHPPGAPIVCAITSSKRDLSVLAVAWNLKGERLFSQQLQLTDGKGKITIPYDRRFGRRVTVAVASISGAEADTRTVLFPGNDDLKVRAVPEKASYKPGDSATIRFQTSQEAALGVAVIDQSVIERAATDQDFGKQWFSGTEDNRPSLNGLSESTLQSLAPEKINADLELAAETLVSDDRSEITSSDITYAQRTEFLRQAAQSLTSTAADLQRHFLQTLLYPRNDAELSAVYPAGAPMIRDPWLHPFRAKFTTEGVADSICFESAGVDGKWGTADDFCALKISHRWFANYDALIRDALRPLADYPASVEDFISHLESSGIRFGALRDRWGNAFQLRMDYVRDSRHFRILSPGPDRRLETPDDLTVAEFTGPFFGQMKARIDQVVNVAPQFPQTVDQFRAVLSAAGIDIGALRDPWGNPYSLAMDRKSAYSDRIELYQYSAYAGPPEQRSMKKPARMTLLYAKVRSRGPDGKEGTYDDIDVAVFTHRMEEPVESQDAAKNPAAPQAGTAGKGAMIGMVVDPSGAFVPHARVRLDDLFVTATDAQGWYEFEDVPEGLHRLTFECTGFRISVIGDVPVKAKMLTRADAVLQVGSVTEAVEIQALPSVMETSTADRAAPSVTTIATPRVREYFPETLFWQPEVVTDSAGRASLKVKLADTITTWHVAVLGSTIDGQITETSAEIRAFQPFQADLDVPPVLTSGDQISLPVPVRNYLNRAQNVAVTALAPKSLSLAAPVGQPSLIQPSSSSNATVAVIAKSYDSGARLRVTAASRGGSDAIEKPIAVHPDGEPREMATGGFAPGKVTLRADVPSSAMVDGLHAEIRVYPSVLSRILESMESMLQRPTGCAEQTISASYPNLQYLQLLQRFGLSDQRARAKAQRNLQEGYQRVLEYQKDDGGFGYWGKANPDIALTAYALRFLEEAKEFLDVDNARLERTRTWLAKQKVEEKPQRAMQIYALARAQLLSNDVIDVWLGEMARSSTLSGSSYALATFALAAMETGKLDAARTVVERLISQARDERGAAHWGFEEITPFYGWGYSGQVETTARVISALAKWREMGKGDSSIDALIQRALLFLSKHAGPHGGWGTTQATVAALDALLKTTPKEESKLGAIQVTSGGVPVAKIPIPPLSATGGPVTIDVSRFIRPGAANEFTVSAATGNLIQAQLNAFWYEPWGAERKAKGLSVKTAYNTLSPAINQAVRCDVELSRPLTASYGMMIVEAGLPPGAEVDRGTLEDVLKDGASAVDRYEVAPDHVTFYVWPYAEGSAFHFTFRPRFAMKAKAAPSVAYDYYNPDERSVVAPATFTVAP